MRRWMCGGPGRRARAGASNRASRPSLSSIGFLEKGVALSWGAQGPSRRQFSHPQIKLLPWRDCGNNTVLLGHLRPQVGLMVESFEGQQWASYKCRHTESGGRHSPPWPLS